MKTSEYAAGNKLSMSFDSFIAMNKASGTIEQQIIKSLNA